MVRVKNEKTRKSFTCSSHKSKSMGTKLIKVSFIKVIANLRNPVTKTRRRFINSTAEAKFS